MSLVRSVAVLLAALLTGAASPNSIPFDIGTLLVPPNSPLQIEHSEPEIPAIFFKGRFRLSGRFEIAFFDGMDYFEVHLFPDRKIAETLPHWKGDLGDDEHSVYIVIDNTDDFVHAVLPRDFRHNARSYSGRITILANGLDTNLDCGFSNYHTRFVSVIKPNRKIAASSEESTPSC